MKEYAAQMGAYSWPLGREKFKVQFRAETFNLFNHSNLQGQTTTLFDNSGALVPNAGQLESPTVTTSRQIQFGMKFVW